MFDEGWEAVALHRAGAACARSERGSRERACGMADYEIAAVLDEVSERLRDARVV
ncbi:MAG: hypothetical protein HQL41_12645 [Alphaproteobacteria bacterium]|nr:hypothetical protein [Alphaproteobacteria bacterium]